MLRKLALGGLAALLILTARQVEASAALRITVGASSVTVQDDGPGDMMAGTPGVVGYFGAVGNFSLNMTTGFTKPAIGSASLPTMDILSLNASGGAGTLTVEFTETDFVPAAGVTGLLASIGGTTDGTVSVDVYIDPANAQFGQAIHLISFDATNLAGTSFAGALQEMLPSLTAPYSITLVVTVVHDGAGRTSFDGEVRPVPEPTTVGLMGAGGLALLAWSRRRRQKTI